MSNQSNNHYDIIIIGSGISGLTCGSMLTQLDGKRVLILERHATAGGYTHSFKRKQYDWDVGVHYVGEMYRGGLYRNLFDFVTADKVEWQPQPELFERFVFPDFTFDCHAGMARFIADLNKAFPDQTAAIDGYQADLVKAAQWFGRMTLAKLLPDWASGMAPLCSAYGARLAMMTTKDYLDQQFDDPQLKAVVAAQWGDVGLPPGISAFAAHALVVCHYSGGGYYPVGGAKVIAESVIPLLEEQGGQLLTRHRVTEIIVEDGRAVGVRAETRGRGEDQSKTFYADQIISSAGAETTFSQLLPESLTRPERSALNRLPGGSAHVCLHIGFKSDPRALGFNGENLWIYNQYDHDAIYAGRNRVVDGTVSGCFLSFPSMKNPQAESHTAQLISFADYESFAEWADSQWQNRDSAYQQRKARIAEALIDYVEQRYPGFAELIDYQELSTPLTTEHFMGHRQGAIYGLPAVPEKFSNRYLKPTTSIKNLYLTGSDVAGHGIVGALMGGVLTTLKLTRHRWPLLKLIFSSQRGGAV